VREWLPVLAQVLGAKPPRRFPVWLARLIAGQGAVMIGTQARGASNAKAKRELGWTPGYPTWRAGFSMRESAANRPRTNGKVERFHQTMAREWAYGVSYRSHRERARALPHWLEHYNRGMPHSSLGGRPPISRVHNVCG
jgi:transposase InsO family protein